MWWIMSVGERDLCVDIVVRAGEAGWKARHYTLNVVTWLEDAISLVDLIV